MLEGWGGGGGVLADQQTGIPSGMLVTDRSDGVIGVGDRMIGKG